MNKNKNKSRKRNKTIIAAIILLLLVCITVGYARIATTLTINGTTGIKDNSWDIHFENLEVTKGANFASETGAATIQADKTKIVYEVTLPLPGDVYEFETDIVNAGTIPAELEDIEITLTGAEEHQNKTKPVTRPVEGGAEGETEVVNVPLNPLVVYGVTYADGTALTKKDDTTSPKVQGDIIQPKEGDTFTDASKKRIKVWVKYNDDIEVSQLPTEPVTATLTVVLHYAQALND